MEIVINILGYLASALVFAAFYVKRIMTLRLIAIGSNLAFIAYAVSAHLLPIFILHSMLLPLNIHRILEIRRGMRSFSNQGQVDVDMLETIIGRKLIKQDEFVVHQGENTWAVCLLKSDSEKVPSQSKSRFFKSGSFLTLLSHYSKNRGVTLEGLELDDESYIIDNDQSGQVKAKPSVKLLTCKSVSEVA